METLGYICRRENCKGQKVVLDIPEKIRKQYPNQYAVSNHLAEMGLATYGTWNRYKINNIVVRVTESYTDVINFNNDDDLVIIWYGSNGQNVKFMYDQLKDPTITYEKFCAKFNSYENEKALEYLD